MASNITIDDIADALGVSKTTVSRAISGKGRISEATREKVRAYIEEHNYRPNIYARGLAQSRTYNIGVVLPGEYGVVDLPFFQECLAGMTRVTAPAGIDVMVTIMEDGDITNLQRIVEHHKVDGIILTRTMIEDRAAAYLQETGFPFVSIGTSDDPDRICIDQDNLGGCLELTEKLLGAGLHRLALIGGNESHVITRTRRRAFEKAHERLGLQPDPDLIYMNVLDPARVDWAVRRIMDQQADCIVCMSDRLAGNILMRCSSLEIRIPEDIRIASYYDSSLLENAVPRVSSVGFNERQLGAEAARLLLRRIEGEPVESRILSNYRIYIRQSTQLAEDCRSS